MISYQHYAAGKYVCIGALFLSQYKRASRGLAWVLSSDVILKNFQNIGWLNTIFSVILGLNRQVYLH